MPTLQGMIAHARALITTPSTPVGLNSVPVVDQILHTSAPYLPGVANYAASQLPKPGQSNTNIPPRAALIPTGRTPVGGHKTPASLGTLAVHQPPKVGTGISVRP